MRCEIDHLVVTAPSLQSGGDHVRAILGVAPGPGGAHQRMGTHNLLLRLGESLFLEVIAPDPAAPHPGRPRWFGLDEVAAPRLAAWVARTDDLGACPADMLAACGAVQTMTRGPREWLITIPADGRLPLGGALPMLIEWQSPARPRARACPRPAARWRRWACATRSRRACRACWRARDSPIGWSSKPARRACGPTSPRPAACAGWAEGYLNQDCGSSARSATCQLLSTSIFTGALHAVLKPSGST